MWHRNIITYQTFEAISQKSKSSRLRRDQLKDKWVLIIIILKLINSKLGKRYNKRNRSNKHNKSQRRKRSHKNNRK